MNKTERQYWNTPLTGVGPGDTPKSIFRACGAPNFDVERFLSDDIGSIQIRRFENYICYPDPAAPEVTEYWRKKGLIKQLHDTPKKEDIPQKYVDRLTAIGVCANREEALVRYAQWASYVPVSSLTEPERKYPLLFVLHGGDDPIYMTETYGFMDLAAREELIVIAPQDAGYQNVGALLDYALEHFPVDPSRVYCAGFSGGAAKTEDTVIAYPQRFAGAILVGQLLRTRFYGNPTREQLDGIPQYRIPLFNIEGLTEAGRTLPMNISQEFNPCIPDVVRTVADNCEGLNAWLAFNRCRRTVTQADMYASAHSADVVERMIGTVFDRTHVERHFDRNYYVGEYMDDNGVAMIRIVGVEDIPHWPVPSFAELAWDYISRFRREVPSGKLIVGEQR